jgi:hypothetical protein
VKVVRWLSRSFQLQSVAACVRPARLRIRVKALSLLASALVSPVAWAGHFSPFAGRFDCPGIENSMVCARAIERSLGVSFLHRVANDRMDVDLLDGRVRSFVDVNRGEIADADDEFYSALEVDRLNRYIVVHRQLYEGSLFGLLDRKTGIFTKIDGYPVFSPDRRWIAVADAGVNGATLQIYEVAESGPKKAYDVDLENSDIADVAWTSSTVLRYVPVTFNLEKRDFVKAAARIVRLSGSVWQ